MSLRQGVGSGPEGPVVRAPVHAALADGRDRQGAWASTDADGNQGRFVFICPATGRKLLVVASDGRDWAEGLPGEPWEHVSVSLLMQPGKTPSWPEMAWVKGLFWGPEAGGEGPQRPSHLNRAAPAPDAIAPTTSQKSRARAPDSRARAAVLASARLDRSETCWRRASSLRSFSITHLSSRSS